MAQSTEERDLLRLLGERLKHLRVVKGLTQEELADIAGVHRTYIGMVERGEKNITFLSARRIAVSLDVSLAEIFDGVKIGK